MIYGLSCRYLLNCTPMPATLLPFAAPPRCTCTTLSPGPGSAMCCGKPLSELYCGMPLLAVPGTGTRERIRSLSDGALRNPYSSEREYRERWCREGKIKGGERGRQKWRHSKWGQQDRQARREERGAESTRASGRRVDGWAGGRECGWVGACVVSGCVAIFF